MRFPVDYPKQRVNRRRWCLSPLFPVLKLTVGQAKSLRECRLRQSMPLANGNNHGGSKRPPRFLKITGGPDRIIPVIRRIGFECIVADLVHPFALLTRERWRVIRIQSYGLDIAGAHDDWPF